MPKFADLLIANPGLYPLLLLAFVAAGILARRMLITIGLIVISLVAIIWPGGQVILLIIGGCFIIYVIAKKNGISVTINGNNNTVIIDQSRGAEDA